MVGASEAVVQGTYDANIEKIGLWIKKAKVPVFLRIGYEFDLPQSAYDPQAYQAAFRYIVDKFRALEVPNVAFVWHSQCSTNFTGSIMDWYPGDDYVDWVGVSIFQTNQIPRAMEIRALAKEHGKPFMIAESTPMGLALDFSRSDWFSKIFRLIDSEDVEAFCYINSNWEATPMFKGQNWGDARLQAMQPKIKELFLEKVAGERYQGAK
jgi:beta-mannanase